MSGTSVVNVPMSKTKFAFLRYVLLPLGCGVRRKFAESFVGQSEKVEALVSLFQGSARLKHCIEEAFERTMQGLVVGLKSPWLMMETGDTDFTEDFREKVTMPFNQQEGLSGQLGLLFLDAFFIDYDTVAEAIPMLLGHDELEDERFLSILLSYTGSENVDDLAEAAWTDLQHNLTVGVGLEGEHPVLRLGAYNRLLMDGVLTHVHEIIFENPAWSNLVDYLSEENIDRDRIRAITSKDPALSQQLTQEQLILNRVNGYRDRLGDIFENRGWLFDIADRLEDTDQEFECELTGQSVKPSKIRIFVDKALEKVHERQGTSTTLLASAALERPSKSALELLRKSREDFSFADWRDAKYSKSCLSMGAAVWPVAGPLMAERYLRECLAFEPDNAEAHYNLYLLELHKERYDVALIHLTKAVELEADLYEPFDLSRFTIDRILGAGGTGVTFEVTSWDDRTMVIKNLWDDLTVVDPRPALRSLQHIVKEPLEGTETVNYLLAHRKSRTCVVSDYIYGEDLETFRKARGGRIPLLQVLEIGFCVARTMWTAHERGLIHRNIKPENVHIGAGMEGLEVTLTDFAVPNFVISIPERVHAVRRFACWSRLGRKIAEAVAGYVAPEMLTGGPEAATEKSDLFALGASLYRLVTGLEPREFDVNKLPRELQTVISKCLHKDPNQRPPNAKALARAFRKLAVLIQSGVTPPEVAPEPEDSIPDIDDQLPDISGLAELPDFAPNSVQAPAYVPTELQISETVRIPPGEDTEERLRSAFESLTPVDPSLPSTVHFGAPQDNGIGAYPEVGAGGQMLVGPGGKLPSPDPFNIAPPGGVADPFASLGAVPAAVGNSDPFGVSDPADPFNLGAPRPPLGAPGADPLGLLSQAPGLGVGGVTDTLQALANTPANVGDSDPFQLSDPNDPFGLPASGDLGPAPGVDPFGLVSMAPGQNQGDPLAGLGDPFDLASGQGMPGMPVANSNDPFGLVSGVNNPAPGNPFGVSPGQASQEDPFGISAEDQGGLALPPGGDPLAKLANAPMSVPSNLEESAEEEPLDPMEALRMLEEMTGGAEPSVPTPPAVQLSDPVDLSNFGVGLDDPFGIDPLGSNSLGGMGLNPLSEPAPRDDPFSADMNLALPDDLGFSGDLNLQAPPSLALGDLALPSDLGAVPDFDGDLALPPDLVGAGLGDPGGLSLDVPNMLAPPAGLVLGDLDDLGEDAPVKKKPVSRRSRTRGGRKGGGDDPNGFGVVISGLGLKSKKEAAIKIIVEVCKVSMDEARDLCRSPVVPVLKRVSKEQAEAAMTRFKAAKINCRINKRRGRRR
jgi:serine/threonine protein kinase/ribosomal protein L7/L12